MKHEMSKAMAHLASHHKGHEDHNRAHGHHGGEKVHFSGGKPGHGKNETPGSSKEGGKLQREEAD